MLDCNRLFSPHKPTRQLHLLLWFHPAGENMGPRPTFLLLSLQTWARDGAGLPGGGCELHPTNVAWADLPPDTDDSGSQGDTLEPRPVRHTNSPELPIRSKLRLSPPSVRVHPLPRSNLSIFSRDFHTMWLLIEGGV